MGNHGRRDVGVAGNVRPLKVAAMNAAILRVWPESLTTDPLARTPRSRPRAGGGHSPFRREGVRDGCLDPAAQAVRRFPGPPLEDPPTSPPRPSTGVVAGARWDDWRTAALPTSTQRRGRCDSSPGAALAAKSTRSIYRRRLCGRRDTKRSGWRDGRADGRTSERPGFGLGG